jgi:hypothetical protein
MSLQHKLASTLLVGTSAIAAVLSMQQLPAQAGGRWGIHFGNGWHHNHHYPRHSIFHPVRNDWRCSNYIDWGTYDASSGKAWLYEKCREYYSGRERVKKIQYIYVGENDYRGRSRWEY